MDRISNSWWFQSLTSPMTALPLAPNEFQVAYAEYAAVGQVQSWSIRDLNAPRST
jgi:hypothetical protein